MGFSIAEDAVVRSYIAGFLLWLLLAPGVGETAEPIVLTIDGPRVPYARIIYTLEVAHGTAVARVDTHWPNGVGDESRMGLVTPEEVQRIRKIFATLVPQRKVAPTPPPTTARFRLSIGPIDQERLWVVSDAEAVLNNPLFEVMTQFRQFVLDRVGPRAYWDRLLLPGERGSLKLTSSPAAWVRVDGLALERKTPIRDLPLETGQHTITLIHPQSKLEWQYEIQITPNAVTVLNVHLK